MRIVPDTNVLVAGILWTGASNRILRAAELGRLTLIVPPEVIDEIEAVLARPKFRSRLAHVGIEAREATALLSRDLEVVELPGRRKYPGLRDPPDAMLIDAALAARARFVVTGDKDLLSIGRYRHVGFVPPALFVNEYSVIFRGTT